MRFFPKVSDQTHAIKCDLAHEVLRSSGKLRLQVTGWSMLPSVFPGDTLIVEHATSGEVSAGDIVLFGRDSRLFVHRVLEKNSNDSKIVTRGDAMPQADPPVGGEELLGKVSRVVRNGKCFEPDRHLRLSERAIAAMVRRSRIAARVIVGIHDMRQSLPIPIQ